MDNTYATHVLVEACRQFIPDVEFIHFSTDEVYGESKTDAPFTEDGSVLRPTNPYSASKAAAEMIIRSYIESFGMNIKVIRCNNVYGPKQYPENLYQNSKDSWKKVNNAPSMEPDVQQLREPSCTWKMLLMQLKLYGKWVHQVMCITLHRMTNSL